MKVLFWLSLSAAVLWTLFVLYANSVRLPDPGPFRGGESLVVVWSIVVIVWIIRRVVAR
jgi:hypothetical protein